ncbi:phage holin family protein [Geomonas propionica]|uniref:Phage holin family protein n=1 Tax=Geomonas propionica TaxID=2798582 RepID=A0ABS0YXJ5_9BACT|nr:phage holin family protein [Geomonas propionica]MBJ6802695.1 phage holin family protein [Geomonas propionica]
MADKDKGEKTIGELVSELTGEVRELFRQELDLFTAEMKEKLVALAKDTAAIGVGGVLVYTGFLVLLAAIVLGLATVMPAWGAALVVAIGLIAIGAVLVLKGGKDVKEMDAKPEETVGALKETVQWAKTLKLTSSRRRGFASKSGTRKAI